MNVRGLGACALVAKPGAFEAASEQLRALQADISRRIPMLEAQIGVRMLHREHRGVPARKCGIRLRHHITLAGRLASGTIDGSTRWKN